MMRKFDYIATNTITLEKDYPLTVTWTGHNYTQILNFVESRLNGNIISIQDTYPRTIKFQVQNTTFLLNVHWKLSLINDKIFITPDLNKLPIYNPKRIA